MNIYSHQIVFLYIAKFCINLPKSVLFLIHKPRLRRWVTARSWYASDSQGWNANSKLLDLSHMKLPVVNHFWPSMAILWFSPLHVGSERKSRISFWYHHSFDWNFFNAELGGEGGEMVKWSIFLPLMIIIMTIKTCETAPKKKKKAKHVKSSLFYSHCLIHSIWKSPHGNMLIRLFQALKWFLAFKS